MAVAVVVIRPSITAAYVEGKYTCDAAPSITNINCGFIPSRIEVVNATDQNVGANWTTEMAADTGMSLAALAIAAGGFTTVAQTDGTNYGFKIGTNANVQVASKVFTWKAFR